VLARHSALALPTGPQSFRRRRRRRQTCLLTGSATAASPRAGWSRPGTSFADSAIPYLPSPITAASPVAARPLRRGRRAPPTAPSAARADVEPGHPSPSGHRRPVRCRPRPGRGGRARQCLSRRRRPHRPTSRLMTSRASARPRLDPVAWSPLDDLTGATAPPPDRGLGLTTGVEVAQPPARPSRRSRRGGSPDPLPGSRSATSSAAPRQTPSSWRSLGATTHTGRILEDLASCSSAWRTSTTPVTVVRAAAVATAGSLYAR
jgi:hypothetical protein